MAVVVNDEQLVIAAYQANQVSEAWTYRSTYIEMLSTGQVDLIKSDKLKGLIFGYYTDDWTEQSLLNTIAPYREHIRGFLPFLIQDTIRSECGDITIVVAQTFSSVLPDTCDLQLPDELFSETAEDLRSRPDTLTKLRYQVAVYESQVATLNNIKGETRKLMRAIQEFQR